MDQINVPIIIKADPGGDLNTWGIKINVNYDNQEQFYQDATNAINYILGNMGITRAELQDLLDEGEVLVTELNGKIVDGTVLLAQLNNSILTGSTLDTALNTTITNAGIAQTNLETATTNAITANNNLDTAIATAGTTQTDLDLSISNAITANNNLDTAISNAGIAQASLQGVVDDANTINTTLGNTISSANTINTTLGNTISSANTINTTLLATISTADTLKTGLDASIITGTQLKNDIDAQIAGGDLLVKGLGFDNATYPNIKAITDAVEGIETTTNIVRYHNLSSGMIADLTLVVGNLVRIGSFTYKISTNTGGIPLDNGLFADTLGSLCFGTIAELEATDYLVVGDEVETSGFYAKGDGGGTKRVMSLTDNGSGRQTANGLYANLINYKSLSAKWFGAKGDGIMDDTNAVIEAFEYLKDNMSLDFGSSNYLTNNPTDVMINAKNIKIHGSRAVIKQNFDIADKGSIFIGSNELSSAITTSIPKRYRTFDVVDSSIFEIGDLVAIRTDEPFGIAPSRNTKKGEMLRIQDIVGNTITVLGGGVCNSYDTLTFSPVLYKAENINSNVEISGISVMNQASERMTYAFRTNWCDNLNVEKNYWESINSGINFDHCQGVKIIGNASKYVNTSGSGYSINMGANTYNVTIEGNTGDYCRHFVTTTGENGMVMNVMISNNSVSNSILSAFDTHIQGRHITIKGNTIKDSYVPINVRSPYSVIKDNKIINCVSPIGVGANNYGISTSEYGWIGLEIIGNTIINENGQSIDGGSYFGSAINVEGVDDNTGIEDETNNYVIIKGNTVSGFNNGGGIIIPSFVSIPYKSIYVEDNKFNILGYSPLTIGRGGTTLTSVKNNIFDKPTRSPQPIIMIGSGGRLEFTGNSYSTTITERIQISNFSYSLIDNNFKTHVGGVAPFYTFSGTSAVEINENDLFYSGTSDLMDIFTGNSYLVTSNSGSNVDVWFQGIIGRTQTGILYFNKIAEGSAHTHTAILTGDTVSINFAGENYVKIQTVNTPK